MGTCAMLKQSKLQKAERDKIFDKIWMKESGCLDKFMFEKDLELPQYKILQLSSANSIKNLPLHIVDDEIIPSYNTELISENKNSFKK